MLSHDSAQNSPTDVTARAIRLLAQRGYDSTLVEELADALDISRSTFFRRFGTKEDIVFADHAYLLGRLGNVMASAEGDAFHAVNLACLSVIKYHLSRPEATLERRALLRSNPSLRNRELVMSHQYERAFRTHLSASSARPILQSWMPSAYAAAAVAVHNDALRAWFADNDIDAVRLLQNELSHLADSLRQYGSPEGRARSRLVVASFEPDAAVETVVAGIRRMLEGRAGDMEPGA